MRFIDADVLIEVLEAWKRDCAECDYESEAGQVIFDCICQIQDTPTADVVPKSEVEKLNKELDELAEEHIDLIVEKDHLFDEVERLTYLLHCYALQYGTVKDQQAVIDKAKAEVAREIFEEIESLLKRTCEKGYRGSISDLFAELKKKYTEGEPNGHV